MGRKAKRKRYRLGKLEKREARYGYLFIAPWIVGVIIFLMKPMIESFQYALADIRITPKGKMISFVGIENYTQIWLEDAHFPVAIMNYFIETLLSVPVIVVFALIIAMLLNGKIKFKGVFRSVFFLPVIIVSGPVMNMLSSQNAATIPVMNVQSISSALATLLPGFIARPITNIFSEMIMLLWYSGVQILIFLSALQKIDRSLYEAAEIDGGSGWECFWKITLPMIKPMILLNAIYTVIFMSNNEQNDIINIIQNAMFAGNKGYGYASAMAWMYSVAVALILTIVALALITRKDAYDRQIKKYRKEQKQQMRALKRARRRGKRNASKTNRLLNKTAQSGR